MENDKIAAFDTLYTNNQIQMLKLLQCYFPKDKQYSFAVLIKLLELDYTIKFGKSLHNMNFSQNTNIESNFDSMFQEIKPFCSKETFSSITKIQSLMQSFKNMQQMFEMIQLFQTFTGASSDDGSSSNGMDFSSLLGMDMSGLSGMDMSSLSGMDMSGLSGMDMSGLGNIDFSMISNLMSLFQGQNKNGTDMSAADMEYSASSTNTIDNEMKVEVENGTNKLDE